MSKYKKFDIATKVQYVEEYLNLSKDNPKLRISEFAYNKGLADSTFNDWVIKYKRNKDRFINGKSADDVIDLSPSLAPTFIEISKDNIVDQSDIRESSTLKLNYKNASLEFNSNELDKVMEILRRW